MNGEFARDGLLWQALPDLLCILDAEGVFRDTNPAWFDVLGRDVDDLENRPFLEFVHPDDIDRTLTVFGKALAGEPVVGFENRYRHKDGTYRWLRWNAIPQGKVFFGVARDVTADKENQATIVTRDDEAELREQFIAILGHDLRNPLAAVRAAHRIVRRDVTDEKALKILMMADEAVLRMSGLIDDMMDFARVRLGDGIGLDVQVESDLHDRLRQTIDELRLAHPAVVIDATFEAREPVECDPARVCQLVSNLVANAITHGEAQSAVRVTTRDIAGDFVLSVANAGPPIPEEARAMLFEPFSRSALPDAQKGLGLGLFIAAGIAEAHDGRLEVASDDATTMFTFSMPRNRRPDP